MDDQAERSYAAYDAAVVSGEPALAVETFLSRPNVFQKYYGPRPGAKLSSLHR